MRTLKTTLALTLGLVVSTSALTGCSSTREIDRTTRRPHTAMRGPAYKRLIITYNEANNLAYRADRYAKALRDSGSVDADTQLRAMELAEDTAKFADDIEWSLANTQRMTWHKNTMDKFWDRFLELYPEDGAFANAYTDGDMRKASPKLKLKNQAEYADLHEYERHDPNWGPLFHPTGESVYKKN
ncbi:MAG: hypothetical protein P1U42_09055 [Phycisphaerales bacterium]|nr:hypothetical protein [Phycisphaerales bacterium]